MTDVKVKDSHGILTPGYETFSLETAACIGDPDLFAECPGYSLLFSRGFRHLATRLVVTGICHLSSFMLKIWDIH